MAGLWWVWHRINTPFSIDDVYRQLSRTKGYYGVHLQHSGDVIARKGSSVVGVLFLYDGTPPCPMPQPPPGSNVGVTSSIVCSVYYWRVIACTGGSRSEAEAIFDEVQTCLKGLATL